MRVTEASFLDFLSEIVRLAQAEEIRSPIVLLGRTGAIDDARLGLEASGLLAEQIAVMEIGFYGREDSERFAESVLRVIRHRRHGASPGDVERRAIALILEKLRNETGAEGQRFAGYAPVLRAVAERVAEETGNLHNFVNEIRASRQASPITLDHIASDILEREQQKVKILSGDLREGLLGQLYSPVEQLDRLSAKLYGTPLPTLPTDMTPEETATYDAALDTWMQEHPFLDGAGNASCAVFEARICVRALRGHRSTDARQRQLELGRKANPFLLELYRAAGSGTETDAVVAEDVGILYASVRSRLSRGEWANLEVSERKSRDNGGAVEFEISIGLKEEETRLYEALLDTGSSMKFGGDLEDIYIDASSSVDVEVGCGSRSVRVVTPVSIACRNLFIHAQEMSVSSQSDRMLGGVEPVYFEAKEVVSDIRKAPRVHGKGTGLEVDWNWRDLTYPYPWTGYEAAKGTEAITDAEVQEIQRRLRRYVVVCKAGIGDLGRHASKFENNRMRRGWGRAVLEALVEEGVFRKVDQFYYLNPNRLREATGLTYADCRRGRSTRKSVSFARKVRASGIV